MTGLRASSTLGRLIVVGAIAVWTVTLYSFFIRPVLFPQPTSLVVQQNDVTGHIAIDRDLTYLGDCANLDWDIPYADRVLLNDQDVDSRGVQRFCTQDIASVYAFSVFADGSESVFRIGPKFYWRQSVSMVYFGAVGIAVGVVLVAILVRLPVFYPAFGYLVQVARRQNRTAVMAAFVAWIVLALFVYWEMRGSPGLIAAATFIEDMRLWLRNIFSGVF